MSISSKTLYSGINGVNDINHISNMNFDNCEENNVREGKQIKEKDEITLDKTQMDSVTQNTIELKNALLKIISAIQINSPDIMRMLSNFYNEFLYQTEFFNYNKQQILAVLNDAVMSTLLTFLRNKKKEKPVVINAILKFFLWLFKED